jgi:hypothetical protein
LLEHKKRPCCSMWSTYISADFLRPSSFFKRALRSTRGRRRRSSPWSHRTSKAKNRHSPQTPYAQRRGPNRSGCRLKWQPEWQPDSKIQKAATMAA